MSDDIDSYPWSVRMSMICIRCGQNYGQHCGDNCRGGYNTKFEKNGNCDLVDIMTYQIKDSIGNKSNKHSE